MFLDTPHRVALEQATQIIESVPQESNPARRAYCVNRPPDPELKNDKGVNIEVGAQTVRVTQSSLRSEVLLNPNKTNYRMPIMTTDQPQTTFPMEWRLNPQDVFFVYGFGYYVLMAKTGGGNTTFRNELQTFPNPNFFGSPGLNLDLMNGLWNNAYMKVTINQNVVTPYWRLTKHLYIPQTQINTTTWPAGSYFNQNDQSSYGMQVVEPNWMFNGANSNQIDIIFPENISSIGIGDTAELRLVCIFDGFLAQNVSATMSA